MQLLFFDFISLSPYRFDIARMCGRYLEFLAQVPDVHGYGALRAEGLLAPDTAVELARRKNLTRALHQEFQDVILPRCERDRLAVARDGLLFGALA